MRWLVFKKATHLSDQGVMAACAYTDTDIDTDTDRHRQTERDTHTHTRTHSRTHARTHAHTHTRTHTHTHTPQHTAHTTKHTIHTTTQHTAHRTHSTLTVDVVAESCHAVPPLADVQHEVQLVLGLGLGSAVVVHLLQTRHGVLQLSLPATPRHRPSHTARPPH